MNTFPKAHMYFKRLKAGFDFSLLTFQELDEAQTLLKKHYKINLITPTPSKQIAPFTPENDKSLLAFLKLQNKTREIKN